MEDLQEALTPEEMEVFAAGCRFLFGRNPGEDDTEPSGSTDDGGKITLP